MRKHLQLCLGFSLLTFFLYDIIWFLAGYDEPFLFRNMAEEIGVDAASSVFFSGISLLCGRLFIKHFNMASESKKVTVLGFLLVGINILFALVVEEVVVSLFAQEEPFDGVWESAYLFGLITSLLTFMYISTEYYKRVSREKEEKTALRLRVLKMQLNPHFVLNSMSVLSGLIDIAPPESRVVCCQAVACLPFFHP